MRSFSSVASASSASVRTIGSSIGTSSPYQLDSNARAKGRPSTWPKQTRPVHETATTRAAPHPARHVEDRIFPLKQTVRHPLDPPIRLLVRRRRGGGGYTSRRCPRAGGGVRHDRAPIV